MLRHPPILRVFFLLAGVPFLLAAPLRAESPTPKFSNVQYGADSRCTLDFWQAPSATPTPVLIYIHGGGFTSLDKAEAPKKLPIEKSLATGISVAAINYRFRPTPVPEILRDCARAVQFIRSKSAEWNVDKSRIGALGVSAGGSVALWLAFRDDLADPASPDSVLRESSRLVCAAAVDFQYTYDIIALEAFFTDRKIPVPPTFRSSSNVEGFYGVVNDPDLTSPAALKGRAECNLPNLVTRDDPPVYLSCRRDLSDFIHHPAHGAAMKKRCDEVGVVAVAEVPAFNLHPADSNSGSMNDFLAKYLLSKP